MPNPELKYIKDCLAMNQLAEEQFGLIKQANPVSDMLGGLTSSILNAGKEEIDNHGIAGGLANLMLPAVLFKISPLFGTLYQVATWFGFSLTDVYQKIMKALAPKLHAGEQVTFEEIDQIGNSLANQAISQAELQKVQSLELSGLRKFARPSVEDTEGFLSGLRNFISSDQDTAKHQVPWLFPNKGPDGKKAGIIERIFGNLLQTPRNRSKAVWFLVGIVIWAVKTLLLGTGLLALSKHMQSKIQGQNPTPQNQSSQHLVNGYNLTTNHQEKKFANNDKEDWEIKLVNNSIENTLLVWIKDIYPNLNLPEEKITNSSQFLRVQEIMAHNYEPENLPNFKMPKGFYSRKQVVDLIVMPLVNSK